ncbi:MAG: sigma-70 family RNA polymerase sigma factor [Candidatus Omnitrophica bacterium]|nr:sigma-70 family RNA polymerase sigma factor [Candidatus Omnitrophota bacterium]
MDETELIRRCINRDPLAWAEFVRRYSSLIRWAIQDRLKKWSYFSRPQDLEEIHQDILVYLWEKGKLEQLRDAKKVAAWLVVTAGNEAAGYFRRKKSEFPPNAVSIFEKIPQKDNFTTLADILASPAYDPAPNEELQDIEKLLTEELERLPLKEKIIIKLNILYGKKYREIAEIMHMPLGSVATAIKNIKHRLKQRISEKMKKSEIKQPVSASYIVETENG